MRVIYIRTTCVLILTTSLPPTKRWSTLPLGLASQCLMAPSLSACVFYVSHLVWPAGHSTLHYVYSPPLYCITQAFPLWWLVLRGSPSPFLLITGPCTCFLSSVFAQSRIRTSLPLPLSHWKHFAFQWTSWEVLHLFSLNVFTGQAKATLLWNYTTNQKITLLKVWKRFFNNNDNGYSPNSRHCQQLVLLSQYLLKEGLT